MDARALKTAWWVRLLFALVALFLPLGHPHIWRQIDTLGVSLRYWLRWTIETETPWPLIPAILHSGDASGLMAMEWPLLNVLAAPLFHFGPELGTVLARAMVLALNLSLVLINIRIWRGQLIAGIEVSRSWQWMPLIGLGLVFFPKFIPDATAMLLVLLANGLLFQRKNRGWAMLLLSTGLLMKPTSVIVLALLLLSSTPVATLRYAAQPLMVSCALTAAYYFKATSWIQSLAGGESLYRVDPQHPIQSLGEFFGDGPSFGLLLLQGLTFYGGIPLLLLLSCLGKTRPLARLWFVLLLQILTIAILDGAHSYHHLYYFLGTLPVLCLLLQASLEDLRLLPWGRPVRTLIILLIIGTAATHLAYEWRPFYIKAPAERFLNFRDCVELKKRLAAWPWNQALVFRTAPRPYPLVGLCFGERVGSQRSAYGLFVDSDPLPADCRVVATAGHLVGASCGI